MAKPTQELVQTWRGIKTTKEHLQSEEAAQTTKLRRSINVARPCPVHASFNLSLSCHTKHLSKLLHGRIRRECADDSQSSGDGSDGVVVRDSGFERELPVERSVEDRFRVLMGRVDRAMTSDALESHSPVAQPWMNFPACMPESVHGVSQPASTSSRSVDSSCCGVGRDLPSVGALPSDPGIIGFGSGARTWGAVHSSSPAPHSGTPVRTASNQRRGVLSCAYARCADLSAPSPKQQDESERRSSASCHHNPLRPLTAPATGERLRPLDSDARLQRSVPSGHASSGPLDQHLQRAGRPSCARKLLPSDASTSASRPVCCKSPQDSELLGSEEFPEIPAEASGQGSLEAESAELRAQMELLHRETNNGLMGGTLFFDDRHTSCRRCVARGSAHLKGPRIGAWPGRPFFRSAR